MILTQFNADARLIQQQANNKSRSHIHRRESQIDLAKDSAEDFQLDQLSHDNKAEQLVNVIVKSEHGQAGKIQMQQLETKYLEEVLLSRQLQSPESKLLDRVDTRNMSPIKNADLFDLQFEPTPTHAKTKADLQEKHNVMIQSPPSSVHAKDIWNVQLSSQVLRSGEAHEQPPLP